MTAIDTNPRRPVLHSNPVRFRMHSMLDHTEQMFAQIFGAGDESILVVQDRAQSAFGRNKCIVWEGDPETFQFTYVSKSSEAILGYPASAWLRPSFWANFIVHPEDQREAIAYCALATGKGKDHDFVYRAMKSDGSIVRLHDVVKVVTGGRGIPIRLRGIMFPIDQGKVIAPVFEKVPQTGSAAA